MKKNKRNRPETDTDQTNDDILADMGKLLQILTALSEVDSEGASNLARKIADKTLETVDKQVLEELKNDDAFQDEIIDDVLALFAQNVDPDMVGDIVKDMDQTKADIKKIIKEITNKHSD